MYLLLIIFLLAAVLYVWWRIRFRYPPANAPRVLCYHKISKRFLWEGTWTTPRRFAVCLDKLLASGHVFITETEYLSALADPLSDNSKRIFLTFDDAYAETLELARGILAVRGVPFHVFVVSGFAGDDNTWDLSLGRPRSRHASWEELRELVQAGATVGSHGATHRDLTFLAPAEVEFELTQSKRVIEENLDIRVRTLSYPFGRCSDSVINAAESAGYEAAFSLYPSHPNEDIRRFALRRNGVYIIDSAWMVAVKLSHHPLYWFEEMKSRAINAVAIVTPLVKRRQKRVRGT